ncbi:MAG: asparagine synthase (glutamine-hydrolyzing) [Anaerolineae bacterium]|nr:asparagine synthase (glutamine-hydrolyzing) [Anaerolineae bacterium]
MCGIAGMYALNSAPIEPQEIEAQITTLIHRGPNQGAVYCSPRGQCGLGIRRLSIIDVAGGHQPLVNEDSTRHMVYNGETYNYRQLRTELEQLGHSPKTLSDGEVILHGYEEWGAAGVLTRLRGMGAFALWDEKQQQLFIGRDRFGIKPLYYAEHAGRLVFASEIKGILCRADFPRRVNRLALDAMLRLGFVPGPATMFEGIYKLPPAHYLIAREDSFTIRNYWQLTYEPSLSLSEAQAVEQFLELLDESVRIRLMSEVPLGTLLSGGLDSGTLTALVQHRLAVDGGTVGGVNLRLSKPTTIPPPGNDDERPTLKTVSIGFDKSAYDESALAQNLADYLKTDHHAISFTDQDFDAYREVMCHLEEPQCSATAVPIYKLYQACRKVGLTVVLTGEGSDELMGGYHWHRGDALVRPLLGLPATVRRAVANSPLPMSAAARRVLSRGTADVARRYQDWLEVSGADVRSTLLLAENGSTHRANGTNPLLMNWAESWGTVKSTAPLHQTLWLESRTRMVDFINFEVDKMSMAHSIEARVPFLDHHLWEFCAALPAHYKLKRGVEKHLLRQATKTILPEATRTRRKKGLASPYAHWLRSKRLPDWAEEALSPQVVTRVGLFDISSVNTLRQTHQSGQDNLGSLLMGVLSTQVWAKEFRI